MVLLGAIGACSKKNDDKKALPPASEWQAPETTPAPGTPVPGTSAPGVPSTAPHAGVAGANADPHAGVPGAPGAQGGTNVEALGLEAPSTDRAIDPNKYIKGSIKPTEETKVGIPTGAVIFVSVKRANPETGEPQGAPLAVKRLRLSTWPVWFNLTEEDAMIAGTRFEGEVVVIAWADQDQDAMSKMPGDVVGQVKTTIPAKDVEIRLDTVLK